MNDATQSAWKFQVFPDGCRYWVWDSSPWGVHQLLSWHAEVEAWQDGLKGMKLRCTWWIGDSTWDVWNCEETGILPLSTNRFVSPKTVSFIFPKWSSKKGWKSIQGGSFKGMLFTCSFLYSWVLECWVPIPWFSKWPHRNLRMSDCRHGGQLTSLHGSVENRCISIRWSFPFMVWKGCLQSTFSHGFMGESRVYLGKTFTTSWSSQETGSWGSWPREGILRFHNSVFGHLWRKATSGTTVGSGGIAV